MTELADAVEQVLESQITSEKPVAIIVAGHNGSGKSTMWNERLAPVLKIPLINADRMMLSILPEARAGRLPGFTVTAAPVPPSEASFALVGKAAPRS